VAIGWLNKCKTCQQETNILWPNDGPAKRIAGEGAAANIGVPPNKEIQVMDLSTGSVRGEQREQGKMEQREKKRETRLQEVHHDELVVIDLLRGKQSLCSISISINQCA
jgi:hypothetical protein